MTFRLGKKGLYVLWEDVLRSSTGEYRIPRCERLNVARIDDRVLRSVIYLYQSVEDAEDGVEIGGSGFLVSQGSEVHSDHFHVYAVSNRPVVHGTDCAPIIRVTQAMRLKGSPEYPPTMAGNREIVSLAWNQWKAHGDSDIAIAYLGLDCVSPSLDQGYGRRFGFTFPSFLLLTHDVIDGFDIGPGEDVYMCGRFQHHPGKHFNEPSTRWGTIALMPSMVELDDGEEEVFLVEMRSLSGFSGSPVVWKLPFTLDWWAASRHLVDAKQFPFHIPVHVTERNVRPESGAMLVGPWLIGVECGSFPHRYPVVHKGTDIVVGDYEAKSHSGVASVVPAWKLRELLDLEEFEMARKEEDEKVTNKKQGSRFDRESATDDDLPALTKRGFNDVLRQVSRKITNSASEPESENASKHEST